MGDSGRATLCSGETACLPGLVIRIEHFTALRDHLVANPRTQSCDAEACLLRHVLLACETSEDEPIPLLNRIIERGY